MGKSKTTSDAGGAQLPAMNTAEAFIGIALTITAVDGLLSATEKQALLLSMVTMPIFTDYSQEELNAAVDRVTQLLTYNSLDDVVQAACNTLTPPLRETAFFLAVDLALADQLLTDNEKLLLKRLQQTLGIDNDMAAKISEVVIIKNRR